MGPYKLLIADVHDPPNIYKDVLNCAKCFKSPGTRGVSWAMRDNLYIFVTHPQHIVGNSNSNIVCPPASRFSRALSKAARRNTRIADPGFVSKHALAAAEGNGVEGGGAPPQAPSKTWLISSIAVVSTPYVTSAVNHARRLA